MDPIDCPDCGKSYTIDESYLGRSFRCHCGRVVNVPFSGRTDGMPPSPPPPPLPDDHPRHPRDYRDRPSAPSGHDGVAALVLGILGLVTGFGLVLSPFAWYMGRNDRRGRIEQGFEPTGAATAGWILGIIGTLFLALILVIFVFVLAALGAAF